MFLLVIAMGSSLLHCSMDDFSKVNETRIKVVSSYPSGHVEVRCPREKKKKKKNQWLKTLPWCCCESDSQINNSTRPRLSKLTWQAVVTFLICGTFAVTVFTLCGVSGFPGWKWKFMNDRCKLSFLSPASAFASPLARLLFTISPKWRACSQATKCPAPPRQKKYFHHYSM